MFSIAQNRSWLLPLMCGGAFALLAAADGRAAQAPATNVPAAKAEPPAGKLEYPAFKVIAERNIFNSSRRSGVKNDTTAPPPAPKIDAFALVGTMDYEKGQFAFFDGTGSQYRKAVKLGDSIAGFKLTEVANNHVKLQAGEEEPKEFPMGMQFRRENEGEWKLLPKTDSFTASYTPESSRSSSYESSSGRSSERPSFDRSSFDRSSSSGRSPDRSNRFGSQPGQPGQSGQGSQSRSPFPGGGQTFTTRPGENATGNVVELPAGSGTIPVPAPAAENTASGDTGDLLERLKRKREQEMKNP